MPWWQNGLLLGLVIFPATAFAVGLVVGTLARRSWTGAVGGALTTVVLSASVANSTLLSWIPVHAMLGYLGGALGCWGRRALDRKNRSSRPS